MALELNSTRKIIGAVFLGSDQIFGTDTFTMVYCACAKVGDITTEDVETSIEELLSTLKTRQARNAARQLADCGDYELISEMNAEDDIKEIIRALQFLSIDNDKIAKDDDTVIARAIELRASEPKDLN